MNPENYDPPTLEEVMREKEDTITALRAEVERLKHMMETHYVARPFVNTLEKQVADMDEELSDLRSQLSARDAEVAFLRDGRDVAVSLCESLGNELAARNAEVRALREAVQTAYGFLWCVNSELGTPHRYSAEKAAYEARKVLRGLLTHEQIGAGINAAVAVVRGGDKS